MAACLGCEPSEVVFTGGGTEADNLAIAGVLSRRPGRVVCSAVEHHAVRAWFAPGFEEQRGPVVDPANVSGAVAEAVLLVERLTGRDVLAVGGHHAIVIVRMERLLPVSSSGCPS